MHDSHGRYKVLLFQHEPPSAENFRNGGGNAEFQSGR